MIGASNHDDTITSVEAPVHSSDITPEIIWFPIGEFKRTPKPGLTMTYTGGDHVTFSRALADLLEGRRIAFGTLNGKLCFRIVVNLAERGLKVHQSQASGKALRRYCEGAKMTIHFSFDDDLDVFVETDRKVI